MEEPAQQTSGDPSRNLSQLERHEAITDLAAANGRVDVSGLAARFGVTTETIRRDLGSLQDRRVLRRVHGGAVPWQRWRHEPRLSVRGSLNAEEKHRIAKRALEEVPPGGSMFIDSGSTLAHFASLLPRDGELTVVTNSIPVAHLLADNDRVSVAVVGGELKKDTMALVDSSTVESISAMFVDVAFLSTDGISPERGCTTPYRIEVSVKRAMMSSARRTVMLIDHSKLGNDQLHRFARVDEIDTIVLGVEASEAEAASLGQLGPLVVRA